MMPALFGHEAHINLVRVRGQCDDTPGLRSSLSMLLRNGDYRPPGMPPSAILLIRVLHDPLPGKIHLNQGQAPADWYQAMQQQVDACYRQAVRPAGYPLPSDAESILFMDETELLAYYLWTLTTRQGMDSWWWRILQDQFAGMPWQQVEAVLTRVPQHSAAIIDHLVLLQVHEACLRMLSPAQALRVVDRMLMQHGLSVDRLIHDSASASETPGVWVEVAAETAHSPSTQPPAVLALFGQTWDEELRAVWPEALHLQGQLLLAVAMTLYRNPSRLHMPAVQRQIARWWRAERNRHIGISPVPPSVSVMEMKSVPVDARGLAGMSPPAAPVQATPSQPVVDQAFGSSASPQQVVPAAVGETPREHPEALDSIAPISGRGISVGPTPFQEVGPAIEDTVNWEVLATPAAETPPVISFPATEAVTLSEMVPAPLLTADRPGVFTQGVLLEDGIESELCGVFYLVNVMKHLALPQRFEDAWSLASGWGSWATLDVLGRGVLGAGPVSNVWQDQLWAVLARLGGYDSSPAPYQDFRCDAPLSLPESWQVDEAPASPQGDLLAALSADSQRWLAAVLPFVTRRIADVLGCRITAVPELMIRRGQVFVSLSHVDVVLDLQDVTVALRKSGMDVNPGWIPSFGRVIQFHYR